MPSKWYTDPQGQAAKLDSQTKASVQASKNLGEQYRQTEQAWLDYDVKQAKRSMREPQSRQSRKDTEGGHKFRDALIVLAFIFLLYLLAHQ